MITYKKSCIFLIHQNTLGGTGCDLRTWDLVGPGKPMSCFRFYSWYIAQCSWMGSTLSSKNPGAT